MDYRILVYDEQHSRSRPATCGKMISLKPHVGKFAPLLLCILLHINGGIQAAYGQRVPGQGETKLILEQDFDAGTISVYRAESKELVLTQNAKEGARPYLHPIMAPDGRGILTEYRPPHHQHQTGLYWGLKMLNGRDYFMNWQGDYYRKISAKALVAEGEEVKWQTVYELLDENGGSVLTETQTWSVHEQEGKFLLDLEWKGEAAADITLGKFYVGGLFLRMPWREGIAGEVVNAVAQRNQEAEGQRAIWTDVAMQIQGRNDLAHIAIFDHPYNKAFPTPWRIDGELGVGPSRQILGDWVIRKGETEIIRYRLVAYTGERDGVELTRLWTDFICEQ